MNPFFSFVQSNNHNLTNLTNSITKKRQRPLRIDIDEYENIEKASICVYKVMSHSLFTGANILVKPSHQSIIVDNFPANSYFISCGQKIDDYIPIQFGNNIRYIQDYPGLIKKISGIPYESFDDY